MKIGEFAIKNQVTAKMLRHYDECGLLKPESVNPETGYREYADSQSHRLNWILILKNLEFSLTEIKTLLSGVVDGQQLINQLVLKRVNLAQSMNEQITKRIQMDRLIMLIQEEGFSMEQKVDLMTLTEAGVHDIKKNMANTEIFIEAVQVVLASVLETDAFSFIRMDIHHFKEVNDTDGYAVGDRIIVACYQAIETALLLTGRPYALGRAGGDEFIAMVKGGSELAEFISEKIVKTLESTDFKGLGCHKSIGVYIGCLEGKGTQKHLYREMMDQTLETITQARRLGKNKIVMEQYSIL